MPTRILGRIALIASLAARCARITSASPSGVRAETNTCGCGVPNTCAFSIAANFMFSIIFSKFIPTCTVPSARFAFSAACCAISRKRFEIVASCRPMFASLIVQI